MSDRLSRPSPSNTACSQTRNSGVAGHVYIVVAVEADLERPAL